MRLDPLAQPADQMPGDAVLAIFFQDQRPLLGPAALLDWRLDGQLTRLLLDGDLTGRAGEHLVLQNNGKLRADWVMLIGGGSWEGLGRGTYASLLEHSVVTACQAGFRDISLCIAPHQDVGIDVLAGDLQKILEKNAFKGLNTCRFSCSTI